MKKTTILIILVSLFLGNVNAQTDQFTPTEAELDQLYLKMQADSNLNKVTRWHGEPEELYYNYKKHLHEADSIWTSDQKSLEILDIGETENFELIPLVDYFTANDSLTSENGVSYLIKTDEATILFDLGLNPKGVHPSPLLHNMDQLDISIDDINMLVISHNHADHIGGPKWSRENSFSFTNYQLDLNGIPVFTPIEMTYPGLSPKHTPKPTKISKGVATIGVIHNPIMINDIAEQALAINVKGKGIVIISGCGHQSIKKIVTRTEILFDEPLYGILGGFHYPMEENRNISWIYKYFLSDKLPWERLTEEDIYHSINLLKSKNIKLIAISGHDSCDKGIGLFKKEFENQYVDLVVGQSISLNE